MKIIPAILTNDLDQLVELEKEAEGVVDRIQIDVIDHKFADNSTVDPSLLKNLNPNLDLDFHLMVKDPIEWIDHCVLKPKNRIIGQIAFMQSQKDFVEKVQRENCLAGLAVDLVTPIKNLDQEILPKVDVVLLMSVPAGFAGQEFSLEIWDKNERLVKIRSELNLKFKICIDGGVTKELVQQMAKAQVDEVAVGRRIFEPDLKQNLESFIT